MNWRFAVEVTVAVSVLGALLGVMLAAALPHRSDERSRTDSEQQ